MSGLTDDQRKRIEENRLRALQKRAAINNSSNKLVSQNQSCTNSKSLQLPNNVSKPVSNLSKSGNLISENKSNPSPWNNGSKPNQVNGPKMNPLNKSLSQNFYRKQNASQSSQSYNNKNMTSMEKSTTVFSGKKITGTFSLISIDRFIVDISYHSEAIEIFKSIQSRKYDANSHNWSFHISDHDKLFNALSPLRPAVCVSPLPSFIHRAIKKASTYIEPRKLDLSCLDESLIEAFLPFQREGVCFGVSRNGRVLIADDMGLGKTVQALGIASYYKQDWPLLIVAPSSVMYSWAESIDRWVGSVDVEDVVIANTGKDNLNGRVLIISYDLISRRESEIKALGFKTIILDESHKLKNPKSIRCKAASSIMKQCKRIIMLSGTPALSKPIELYSQIAGIENQLFPLYQEFGIRYCAGKQLPWGWDYNGSSNMTELQILLEKTIMIRRIKGDVLKQLPSKQRMIVQLDPNSILTNSKTLQNAMEQYTNSCSNSERHGALLQYYNESAVAKHKAVCDYVKELIEQDKKFLVFCHHKYMLDKLSELCDKMKTPYIRIDGSVGSEGRQNLVDHFQQVTDTKVAILSITAANTGITLTAAQLVVFAELYWNPGALIQAEDRAHRIGQSDSVLVQYLVAKGTADDHIWPMIQNKLNVLQKVGLSSGNFSEAGTSNQKTKETGILKYFEKDDDIDDVDDLLAAVKNVEEEQTSFKRTQEEGENEASFKRRKLSDDSEEF